MADIFALHREIVEEGHLETLARDPRIQFGTPARRYIGAEILPDRPVTENQFTESDIRYFTSPANDATRYSEPQMKQVAQAATFDVKLGELDIAAQLTGRDFDNIRKIAIANPTGAKNQLIAWLNTGLNLSLVEKVEIQRWNALLDAAVQIVGTNGKVSTVPLDNPVGHRITVPSGTTAAPTGWYGNEDPMDAIFAMKTFLSGKGYELLRVIGDSEITNALVTNPVMQSRLGTLTIAGGELTSRVGLVSKQALDAYIQSFGIPAIEEYNLTYRTQIGTGFFKRRGTLAFICATGRSETIDNGDATLSVLENVAGYNAVGLAVGEDNPGRVIRTEARNLKPIGIYGQAFQTSFPVLTEPEGVGVLTIPRPIAA
ncbi:major capsid protein [Chroococcidiopsis sp.]|uniref:major capsid protein n=1 Tax=Chroococcidiopsis sp. TaxID=3088168 RepID=UPI003F32C1C8